MAYISHIFLAKTLTIAVFYASINRKQLVVDSCELTALKT
jgi:hypothetical protein